MVARAIHGFDRVVARCRLPELFAPVLDVGEKVLQAVDEARGPASKALQQLEPEICAPPLGVEAELQRMLSDDQLAELDTRRSRRGQSADGKGLRGMHQRDYSAYE